MPYGNLMGYLAAAQQRGAMKPPQQPTSMSQPNMALLGQLLQGGMGSGGFLGGGQRPPTKAGPLWNGQRAVGMGINQRPQGPQQTLGGNLSALFGGGFPMNGLPKIPQHKAAGQTFGGFQQAMSPYLSRTPYRGGF